MEIPIFVVISGSDLYGIPEPSDVDIRGVHVLDRELFVKNCLYKSKEGEVINKMFGKCDFVSFELGKFLRELLKPNANFIEMALSNKVLYSSKYHEDIKEIAYNCICKKLYHHWKGFTSHLKKLCEKESYINPKTLLYVLRAYYQGILCLDRGEFKPDFNSFISLDCYDEEITNYLFKCKVNKKSVDDGYREKIKTYFYELDKLLDESYKNSNLIDEPPETARIKAVELYKKLYFDNCKI
ncbi:MAG: nucleotidyltransferase domain-containing protein [Methanocaldococcus sp.]